MANAHKGELAFQAGGQDYTLRFSANAICELEQQVDRAEADIVASLQGTPRYSLIRAVLWAGLTGHHPGITLKAAGDIMDALGGLAAAMQIVTRGLVLAFPDAPQGAETKDEDPPNGAGTGPDSMKAG
jgi:hypothetical protein